MDTRRARGAAAGSVALVGAGPGDRGLITVRGHALLRAADVVVHDRLVPGSILAAARPDALVIDAGKRPGAPARAQAAIARALIRHARAGRTVVRLKGGDPFVFGRGGEEAEALARAGIPFEVVPGVSSAFAGPAAAGIPVTHRGLASSVVVATATGARGEVDWDAIAAADTAVVLMGLERLTDVAASLMAAGVPRARPVAVVQDATLPTQRTVTGPLSAIAHRAARAGLRSPAVIVVGRVAGLRAVIGGWDTRPLSGRRVLVTRSREQASELSGTLLELGAEVVEAPALEVLAPASWSSLDRGIVAVAGGRADWAVFTSANGVRSFWRRLAAAGLDARSLAGARVAAVGPGTASELARCGVKADLVPPSFTTAALAAAFPKGPGRAILVRVTGAPRALDDALRAKGWTVARASAYRIRGARSMPAAVRRAVQAGEIDVLTFASSGTVRAFMAALRGKPGRGSKIACIGPETARAARAAGLRVHAVADPHTIPALAAAVVGLVGPRPARRR
ncbi:MAG TPA: uroporphyrinogen-III C-methyltransferase [Actinomycetota bacterium]